MQARGCGETQGSKVQRYRQALNTLSLAVVDSMLYSECRAGCTHMGQRPLH